MSSQSPILTQVLAPFACDHCGRCCEKLLFTCCADDGYAQVGTFGMLLAPGEQRLFPRTESLWRSGQKILAYQTVEEPCPHWMGSGCRIYERRPRACKAYPVWWEFVWRADTNCPQVGVVGELGDYREQILAAHGIMRFQRWLYGTQREMEYFDLAERRWKRASPDSVQGRG